MPPNTHQEQPVGPTSLPPVSSVLQTAPSGLPPQHAAVAASQQPGFPPTPQQVALQAKFLVEQYKNDPYKLAAAIEQLKAAHLAGHFNVVVKPVEN